MEIIDKAMPNILSPESHTPFLIFEEVYGVFLAMNNSRHEKELSVKVRTHKPLHLRILASSDFLSF